MVIFHGYVSLPEGKLFEHVESPFFSRAMFWSEF